MKLVFVFLVAFCAVQCFGASIANNEERNKTYEDNQIACVLKALNEAKTAVKEGKEQCNNDKKCLIKLAIRVTVNLWKDLNKCRNNMVFVLGEPRMTEDEIWKLLDDIINKFGDQLPQDIKDLFEELKKILNGDSGDDKTDCDKQRRHESEQLSELLVNKTEECTKAPDMERCLKGVLFEFAEEQESINDEYQECMGSNFRDNIVFVLGEARISDEQLSTLMHQINFLLGDKPAKQVADLMEQYKKILNADSEEKKTECFQQKGDDLYMLGRQVVNDYTNCFWGLDYEKCVAEHLVTYPKKQEKILEEYEECIKKNL